MVTYARRRSTDVDDDHGEEVPTTRPIRQSRVREAAISGFIVLFLAIATVWSVPDSPVKTSLTPVLMPIARATGLDQSWRMFSPDPPRVVSEIETYVLFDNGERRMWTFERDRNVLSSFHYDRWRKLKEQLLAEELLRPGFAMWVVRQLAEPGEKAVRVWMVRDTRTTPAPGQDGPNKRERKLMFDRGFASSK